MSRTLADLFTKRGPSLGLDEKASSTLIQNLNNTTTPIAQGGALTPDEQETDDFRLIKLIFDGSDSMDVVEDALRESVNDIVFPGLLGGAKSQVGAIRYSGLAFNTQMKPLWKGEWLPLNDQFPRLTATEYRASGATALNRAVLDGVTDLTAYALKIQNITGTTPECCLVVLSDGANNQAPKDPDPVYQVLSQLSPELFTTAFIGFETGERVDFRAIAQALGFRDIQEAKTKPGESQDEMRRRFRHIMKVFSSQLIQRVSQSQVKANAPKTASNSSSGFWTP